MLFFVQSLISASLFSLRHGGMIVKVILCCIQCCLWCFEKCLKFLNRNAYIETAIYGYSFCRAAFTAFMLILRNILRMAAVNSIGSLVLFLAKVVVVAGGVMLSLLYFDVSDNSSSLC